MKDRHSALIEKAAAMALLTGLGGVLLAILAFSLGIAGREFGDFLMEWPTPSWRLLALGGMAMAFSSTAMAAAGTMSRGGDAPPSTLTMASALGGAGLISALSAILLTCLELEGASIALRISLALAALGVATAAGAAIRAGRATSAAARWLRIVAMLACACAGASGAGVALTLGVDLPRRVGIPQNWLEACSAILSLLLVASSLSALLATKTATALSAPKLLPPESIGARATLDLDCPLCGERQTLGTGFVRCGACRVPLRIALEEPRCECGYLLFRVEGSQCPECGRPVPRGSGAAATATPIAGGPTSTTGP